MDYNGKDLLLQFLDKNSDTFEAIFNCVHKFAVMNKQSIFRKDALQRGFISDEHTDISLKKAYGVKVNGDVVDFDVIVEGEFMAQWQESRRDDFEEVQESELFTLNCIMQVTDKETNFKIKNL